MPEPRGLHLFSIGKGFSPAELDYKQCITLHFTRILDTFDIGPSTLNHNNIQSK